MSNQLLFETFIYGNLELPYRNKKIRTLKLDDIINIVKENKDEDLGYFWGWRYYKNFKVLISIYENYIYQQPKQMLKFITLAKLIINMGEKKYNLYHIDNITNYQEELAFYFIFKELEDRINFMNTYTSTGITSIKKEFDTTFMKFISSYQGIFALCNYLLPYEENNWSPSWSVTFEQDQAIIEGIDLYFDYYFKYPNIKFNLYLCSDIKSLIDRTKFLEKKCPQYYRDYIINRIEKLSKNIFYSFPYKLIYEDYYQWLNYENVFSPVLIQYLSIDKISKDIWLLAIIPRYLCAYLMGFAIISSDVPTDKNLQKVIEKVIEKGLTNYWHDIYKNNQELLRIKSMNISCGNQIEENSILDLTYTPVEKYNSDDTLLLFNEGVYHVFTYPEFNDIINKERNPYNRSNVPLLTPLIAALKLKKKIKRQLNYRYLDIDLDNTIEDNFNNIKSKLKEDIDFSLRTNLNNLTNTFFNMFFNHN